MKKETMAEIINKAKEDGLDISPDDIYDYEEKKKELKD